MTPQDEPLLSIWSRRALTVPLYLLLAALALVTAPLWIVVGLVWDALTGAARVLPRTRALAFFALYFGCEAIGILSATFLWCVTLGGRIGGPARYLTLNAALQRHWTDALFSGGRRLFSMSLVVSTEGLELPLRGPLLLFARHASMADSVLAAALVANPGRLLLRYVLKRELLWDPCLDIVGRRLPNAFVNRRGPGLAAEVAAIAGLAEGLDAGSAVLIYPEGKRFTEARREEAVAALREKGAPELAGIASGFRNVLPPRLRGPLALLDAAAKLSRGAPPPAPPGDAVGSSVAAAGVDVVLLEHAGFEGAASFSELWKGALVGGTLRVRLRRIPASAIPREGRDRWLFETWAETDRWISEARRDEPSVR